MSTWVKWILGILAALNTLALGLVGLVDNAPLGLIVTFHIVSAVIAIALVTFEFLKARREKKKEREAELAPGREALIGHFRPKAAGFEGRHAVMARLCRWLVEDGPGVQVVTGRPGSGKSAVLGRIVVLANPETRTDILRQEPELPGEQRRLPEGSITAAVHAGGKSANDVALEIASALDVTAPLPALLCEALRARDEKTAIVIDALDEADNPHKIIEELLVPLAQLDKIKLLVATRAPYEKMLKAECGAEIIDLDSQAYFEENDLISYVENRLLATQLYAGHDAAAHQVALAVANRADQSYLFAELATRVLQNGPERVDTSVPDWEQSQLPGTLSDAIARDLRRFDASERVRIVSVLTPLAYAGPSGLRKEHKLWETMATAIAGDRYGTSEIIAVLENERVFPYYVREKGDHERYWLFHEEFAAYLRERQPDDVHLRLIEALLGMVVELPDAAARDWSKVFARMVVSADAGIERAAYIFERAIPRLRGLGTPGEVASTLQLISQQFGIDWQVDDLGIQRSWRVLWTWWRKYSPHWILEEHEPLTPLGLWKLAVCELEGRPAVISGGEDGWIRFWDLEERRQMRASFKGHDGRITSLAVAARKDRLLLLSGDHTGVLHIWDLTTGQETGSQIRSHVRDVSSIATTKWADEWLAVTGSVDGSVQVWNLLTGDSVGNPTNAHEGIVRAVAMAELDGRLLVVTGREGGTIQVVDVISGQDVYDPITGHGRVYIPGTVREKGITALEVAKVDGRHTIVSAGQDGTIRLWDLASGEPVKEPMVGVEKGWVYSMEVGKLNEMPMVICGGTDGKVRMLDLSSGELIRRPRTGHDERITAVAFGKVEDQPVIVSAGGGTVRVFDFGSEEDENDQEDEELYFGEVMVTELDGRVVAVSGGDKIRFWDLETGQQHRESITAHEDDKTREFILARIDDQPVVVAGFPVTGMWDLSTGEHLGEPVENQAVLTPWFGSCEMNGKLLVIAGGEAGHFEIWDLTTRRSIGDMHCEDGDWATLAVSEFEGKCIAVTAGEYNGVIRVWDVATQSIVGDAIQGPEKGVARIAIGSFRGEAVLAVSGNDGSLCLLNLGNRQVLSELLTPRRPISGALTFAHLAGRNMLVGGGTDGVIRFWDLQSEQQVLSIDSGFPVVGLAVVGNDQLFVACHNGLFLLEPTFE